MHLNLVMSLPLLTSSFAGFALRELSLVESKLLRLSVTPCLQYRAFCDSNEDRAL